MNTAQTLKAKGHLPAESLDNLDLLVSVRSHSLAAIQDAELCCGHPDYYDQEIADYPDAGKLATLLSCDASYAASLIRMHQRARLRAGWPQRCHSEYEKYDAYTVVKYFCDADSFTDSITRTVRDEELEQILEAGVWNVTRERLWEAWAGKSNLDVALWLCEVAYLRVGVILIRIADGTDGSEHQIHIESIPIPGSTIGLGYFPSGSCRDHVKCQFDTGYRPGLMGTAKLICHEIGHCVGLEHEFNNQNVHQSVMSYSPPRLFYGFSTGKAPYPLPRDASYPELTSLYGGKPVPEIDPPDPDPPDPLPPTDDDVVGLLQEQVRLLKHIGALLRGSEGNATKSRLRTIEQLLRDRQ